MFNRVLTYDLKNGSNVDYVDLYVLLDDYNAIKLTESSYFIKTTDDYDTFKNKVLEVTHKDDTVFAIVIADNSLECRKIR